MFLRWFIVACAGEKRLVAVAVALEDIPLLFCISLWFVGFDVF